MTTEPGDAAEYLRALVRDAKESVVVRPPHPAAMTVEDLGLSSWSLLGAIGAHTSGILVDSGWLRILGGSSGGGLPGLDEASDASSGLLVVAYDVLGGVFALDGGALGSGDGSVFFFGVDSLNWADLHVGYSDFVAAMLGGSMTGFYQPLRWHGWQDTVGPVRPDEGLSLYPFPCSEEGQDIAASTKRAVPFRELIDLHNSLAAQVNGAAASPPLPMPRIR